MSNYYHGAKASKQATSVSTPVVADSSIHLIVGTAPVHTVGGKANEPVYASNYAEAVAAMGYSDEWDKYDICEEIYSSFKLYSNGPIIMVNVLDPAKHLKGAETVEKTLAGGITELPYEAVSDTVEVKGYDGEDSLTETYTRGEDYDLFYTDGVLRLERIESGKIKADNARLNIKFNSVDPSKVTKKEIIGGYDTNTNKSSGFELVDSVYPKYGVIPTLFLAPNFSTDSEVAAIMAAKAAGDDVIIADTAGRLHTKSNLMEELGKVQRIIKREIPEGPAEVLIVLDAVTGQNGFMQAETFSKVMPITGVVLTKFDNTSKGGIVLAIADKLKMPIRYVGLGEGVDDLQLFDPRTFVETLLDARNPE